MCNPVVFSIFARLCNQHHCLTPEHFHHPKETLDLLAVTPFPSLATPGKAWFTFCFCGFADTCMTGIIQYVLSVPGFFHVA